MTDLGARTRQIGAFPVDGENIRVFAGGFGNRLFTQKAGSRNFPSFIQPLGSLRRKKTIHCRKKGSPGKLFQKALPKGSHNECQPNIGASESQEL